MKKTLFIIAIVSLFFASCGKDETKIIGEDFAGTWTMYDTVQGTLAASQKTFTVSNLGSTQLTVTDFPINTYTFTIGKTTTTDNVTSLNVVPYSIEYLTITKVSSSVFTYEYKRYECAGTLCPTIHKGRATKN